MSPSAVLELWYAALRHPLGVKVPTNDADRLKTKLYLARKGAEDPQLDALMVLTSPLNQSGEVWIAHRNVDVKPEDLADV